MEDNIIIKTVWYDEVEDFFEIELMAKNKFIIAKQNCYLSTENLSEIYNNLLDYLKRPNFEKLIIVGELMKEATPGFSMKFLPIKRNSEVIIEMDMEIGDSLERNHRCQFYVLTNIYYLEKLHKIIMLLSEKYRFEEVKLH